MESNIFNFCVPYLEKLRWLLFKCCAEDGVHLQSFSEQTGMPEERIRSVLFDADYDYSVMSAREMALWCHAATGRTPDLRMLRIPDELRNGRARP